LGSGGTAPRIFNLGASWRSVVSFMPRPLNSRRKNPYIRWIGGWVGPSNTNNCNKKNNINNNTSNNTNNRNNNTSNNINNDNSNNNNNNDNGDNTKVIIILKIKIILIPYNNNNNIDK
jgi:hypothetical protein